jgi:hypothetical protein
MIDATTHTRKIWRSHFDGADSTTSDNESVNVEINFFISYEGEFLYNLPSNENEMLK